MRWLLYNPLWAMRGAVHVLRSQTSARLQLAAAVLTVSAGFYFKIERWEWIAVVFAIGLVLAAEAFNTALESLADAVHPDRHPLIGRAKDCAAGAVLLAAIAAAAAGAIVFLPHLLAWLTFTKT